MNISIRTLDATEWQVYRSTRLAALQDAPEAFGGSYEHAAEYPDQQWRDWCTQPSWFAFADGAASAEQRVKPIGMVRVFRHNDKPLPELVSMWVSPWARGTSAAGGLVTAVLDWARIEGDPGVYLRVMTANSRARSLYERVGFVPNGIIDTLPDGRAEIEMELRF